MRVYLAPKVLIVDEFGVWPYDRTAATALFALVSARYERGSMVLTSNKGFGEWGEVLGDPVIATAILDRLLHHSHVVNNLAFTTGPAVLSLKRRGKPAKQARPPARVS